MKNLFLYIFLFLFLLPIGSAFAQLTVTQGATMGLTPLQLVQSQLVGQGITVSNATFNGSSAIINSDQIGYFTTSGPAMIQLGIEAGVLLTSGKASNAIGPNNSPGMGSSTIYADDPDLNIVATITTNDKCVLEFDFVPQADTLKFNYVFGSEEFYEYCYSFNDAFGFFVSGPNPYGGNYTSLNIALIPGTSVPVTINNVNSGSYPAYYVDNQGLNGQTIVYDGFTTVLTAWCLVIPCIPYHIKLAVGDAGDYSYDSSVFSTEPFLLLLRFIRMG